MRFRVIAVALSVSHREKLGSTQVGSSPNVGGTFSPSHTGASIADGTLAAPDAAQNFFYRFSV